jgi:LysR family nitrogen assimilation transcriptional regulator
MGRIDSLSTLRLFAQVADLGSLTRAAALLEAAPSAVSRQISTFESECGGRLFHRTGRGLALTELGQRILPKVQAVLAVAEELGHEIQGAAGVPVGEVAVGIVGGAAGMLIPALFRQVSALYPGVTLRVWEGALGQLEEWIAIGKVDMAMVGRPGMDMAQGEFFLARSSSFLVGPPGDALTSAATVDFALLHELPLVLSGGASGIRQTIEQHARQRGVALSVVMEAESMTVQKAMAADGSAYTVLPQYAVKLELQAGAVSASRIVNPALERSIALVATSHHPLTLAGRAVFRLVRQIGENAT